MRLSRWDEPVFCNDVALDSLTTDSPSIGVPAFLGRSAVHEERPLVIDAFDTAVATQTASWNLEVALCSLSIAIAG